VSRNINAVGTLAIAARTNIDQTHLVPLTKERIRCIDPGTRRRDDTKSWYLPQTGISDPRPSSFQTECCDWAPTRNARLVFGPITFKLNGSEVTLIQNARVVFEPTIGDATPMYNARVKQRSTMLISRTICPRRTNYDWSSC
jgi:hypothetical protein